MKRIDRIINSYYWYLSPIIGTYFIFLYFLIELAHNIGMKGGVVYEKDGIIT